jgi:hypothetical protein
MMLDYLIEENNLLPEFKAAGLTERDLVFIKEQVAGPKTNGNAKVSF